MGKLFIDGLEVSAVFYELGSQAAGASMPIDARISGEPSALRRACQEGDTILALKDGHRLPVTVTKLEQEGQVALVRLEPSPNPETT